MNQLIVEWTEVGQTKSAQIADQQASKQPGAVRIGRDPARCDIVCQHPTVSGLHVEIFFDPHRRCFCLKNLRESNPPIVQRQRLTQGTIVLQEGMSFYLGQLEMKVVAIATTLPPTVIAPPPTAAIEKPLQPTAPPPASASSPTFPIASPTAPVSTSPAYGLVCPKCRQVSAYEHLRVGCPWCGTSLAAAESILMAPDRH